MKSMRKILILLILIAYGFSSYIFMQYYKTKEVLNIQSGSKTNIIVKEWNKDKSPEEKLNEIRQISKAESVNIYKIVYKPIVASQKQKIVIYAAIGDEKKLKEEFSLKSGRIFNNLDSQESYLSSTFSNDPKQLGKLDLFNNEVIIELKPLEAAKNENIRGTYLIDSLDFKVVEKIKQDFQDKIGFEFENNNSRMLIQDIFDKNLIIVLIIVFILISLSFLYYVLLGYKELAIKKMFGYTNRELILKCLLRDSIKIHGISLFIAIIIQVLYLYNYNGFSGIKDFGIQWLIIQGIFTIASNAIAIIPFFMVNAIEVSKMLKNKKPMRLIQILNYGSKFLFSMFLLIMFINLFNSYKDLQIQNSNAEKWETTKNYSFYEYQYNPTDDDNLWEYQLSMKSQELFELENKKGGILIRPSDGIISKNIMVNNIQTNVPIYDPNEGNMIQVNSRYLNLNPIYDLKNEKITLPEEYGDYLIVLVPNKYHDMEEEILKIYTKWYEFSIFTNEDMHNKSIGKSVNEHKQVTVKLIFIKDNQKCFLYNPTLETKNQNYIKEPIISVINSVNMGGDCYLNYMTGGTFYPKVDDSKNPYNELNYNIRLVGLDNEIFSTPLLYSKVDSYMYNLKNQIMLKIFLATVLIITEVIIIVFMVLNYLERNKFVNCIKKLNGYSFYKRHNKFIAMIFILWLVISLVGYVFKTFTWISILEFVIPCSVVEFILIILMIKLLEKKNVIDVLKGM